MYPVSYGALAPLLGLVRLRACLGDSLDQADLGRYQRDGSRGTHVNDGSLANPNRPVSVVINDLRFRFDPVVTLPGITHYEWHLSIVIFKMGLDIPSAGAATLRFGGTGSSALKATSSSQQGTVSDAELGPVGRLTSGMV